MIRRAFISALGVMILAGPILSGATFAHEAKPPFIGTFTLRGDETLTLVEGLQSPTLYRVCAADIRDNACEIDLDSGRDLKIDSGNCIDIVATRLTVKKRADTCIGTYDRIQ